MIRLFLILFFLGFSVVYAGGMGGNLTKDAVNELFERSKGYEERLRGVIGEEVLRKREEQGLKDAKQVEEGFKTEEMRERVKQYQEVIKEDLRRLGVEVNGTGNGTGDVVRGKEVGKSRKESDGFKLGADERVYIFVSSSMPEEVVRRYVRDSMKVRGEVYFVLRGGVRGLAYLEPTARWVLGMLLEDRSCNLMRDRCRLYDREFLIDPTLFRRYGIRKVPFVVYVRGEDVVVVKSGGAISLEEHLKRIMASLKGLR